MIFHTKCEILLVLFTIKYTMKQCVAEDTSVILEENEDSDEEDAIKEALILVELLKSAKLKPILRSIDDTTVDDSTCATTTVKTLTTADHKETSFAINAETKTTATMPSIPDEQYPQHRRSFLPSWPRIPAPHAHRDHHHTHHIPHEPHADFYRPRAFFRRRFPDYYYFQNYYDFPRVNKEEKPIPGFRRFQSDDIQTNSTSSDKTTSTTVSPLSSTTKIMLATRTKWKGNSDSHPVRMKPEAAKNKRVIFQKFKPKLEKIRKLRSKPRTNTPSSNTKTTLGTTTKITTETKLLHAKEQKMTTKEKVTTKYQSKDPLMDEIASELLRELNGSKIFDNQKDKIMNEVTETKTEKIRTTLRIHLDGSTRYNIPFPENHAFCYTNPESLFCRTP